MIHMLTEQKTGGYMFKLIIALGVAGVLLPAETVTDTVSNTAEKAPQVSTYEAFNAAHSLYTDVTSFCDRNAETCQTGKAIASSAAHKIVSELQQITSQENREGSVSTFDMTHTGAVQK